MPIRTPHAFTLDIVKPTKIPIMEFYQTDVNTAQMDISITNNDEVVDLTGHSLILNIKKADGTEIQNLATIEDSVKGLVNVSLTTQSLTALGECRVQLTVFSGETRKSTHEFKYYVKASLLNAEVPLSSNEYGLLLQLIDEVQTVENILNTSEATRITNEEDRIILFNQLSTLKTELETLQWQLNSLEDNVEESEYAREYNEQQREILKGQLDTLQAELELLQTELNDLNSTVNSNEETRKTNEAQRQANEEDRVELKGQLDSLKSSLQSLENTLNTNDATRTNTVNNKMYEVDNKVVNYEAIITDIQNRFSLLSTSVQQASEVINARTSTIRNKTFTDLNKRIEEAEKDILTQQSTQVTDNISYMNVLTNSLDGATDVTIKGNTLVNLYPDNIEKVLPIPLSLVDRVDSVYHLANTLEGNSEFNLKGQSFVNIVRNGNFVNTSGWTGINSTFSVNNNTLSIVGNGTGNAPRLYQTTNIPCVSGKKVYVRLNAKVTNTNATEIALQLRQQDNSKVSVVQTIPTPTQNQQYTLGGIVTIPSDWVGNINVYTNHAYVDSTTANSKVMEIQNVIALDLTSLGLDTLTADQINAMLPTHFEGIGNVENTTIKSIGENLFDTSLLKGFTFDATEQAYKQTIVAPIYSNLIKLKPNTSYTISVKAKVSNNANIYAYSCTVKDENGLVTLGTVYNSTNTNNYAIRSFTFTTSNVTKYSFSFVTNNGDTDCIYYIKDIQINEGTTPKTYSAYRSTSITVTDTLRGVSPTVYDEYVGSKKTTRVGRVVLNGSESGWALTDSTSTNTLRFTITLSIQNKLDVQGLGFLCDKFTPLLDAHSLDVEACQMSTSTQGTLHIRMSKTKVSDLATFKTWLASNNTEILYRLATPTESTITPISIPIYNNGTLIVEPTKLYPKLSSQDTFDKSINLKPSTLYSIFINAKNTGTLEVDLGGIKGNITPTTSYTNNKVTITTPSTLTHSMLKLKGGNISTKDYMVIETDVVEPKYFSGVSSVDSDVVVKSIGENLFDGILEIGTYSATTGLPTTTTGIVRSKNFIPVKPSSTYTTQEISTNIGTRVFEYDKNYSFIKTYLKYNATPTFTVSNNCFYLKFHCGDGTRTINDKFMLNEGTVAKPYQPYKEDKLTLSEYLLPEHFPLRSVGGVSDEYIGKKLYKRLGKVVLNGSETGWLLQDNALVNTLMFRIPSFNGLTVAKTLLSDKFISKNIYSLDEEGVYIGGGGNFYLRILRSKCSDLATFKTWLPSNNVTVIYELETPTEINLDRPLNIQLYKNGSIVTEPTKLLPKLSYTFPTNINSGLVGIQKSLQNVKDNQNFIMAYMLDLETRLSLIEGGM